jgi:hypothetical protein
VSPLACDPRAANAARLALALRFTRFQQEDSSMNTIPLAPLIALIAGILILVRPRLLNYIVAIYLIVIGVIGLFGTGNLFR